jgi:hypothetical protein
MLDQSSTRCATKHPAHSILWPPVSQESVKARHPQLLYESKLYKILQGGGAQRDVAGAICAAVHDMPWLAAAGFRSMSSCGMLGMVIVRHNLLLVLLVARAHDLHKGGAVAVRHIATWVLLHHGWRTP